MGLVIAIGLSAFDMMRYRIALRAVSLVDYLMIWPALCLAWPCLRWRGAGHVANASQQEQDRRPRWRKLYVEMSVAIGLAYGLIATGLELLWRGWLVLPVQSLST